ncbi:DUF4761 domain-containing protein [Brenneria populi]|uniref:DUF4761 domain-containing protein n=1 Tax=Brenneria populi TaxID=1505588 RepID=A0ABU6JRQ1_9GAMM|nr:DUF4761 domain-containing protein [Brenneria populi Li et al. 2015]
MVIVAGAVINKRGVVNLVQLNSKTSLYRGFTILKLPRKKPYNRQRYQITRESDYFGLDFALAEACKTIDKLCGVKND